MSLNVGVAAPAPNTLATTITLSETEVSSNSSLSHLGTFTTAAATGGND